MSMPIDRRAVFTGMVAVFSLNAIAAKALATPDADTDKRPDVAVFARSAAIEDASLSPDGKRIALLTRLANEYVILVYEVATEKTRRIVVGEAKVRGLFWGSNDNIMIQITVTADIRQFAGRKQEHLLVHNIDLRTGKSKPLFRLMEGYYSTVQGNLQRVRVGDKYYVTASNYDMNDNAYPLNLFRFDLDGGEPKPLDLGDRNTCNWVLTPAGVPVARCVYDRDFRTWSLEFSNGKGGWPVVFKQKEAIDYPSLIGLGRSETSVIIYIESGEYGGSYYEVGADGILSEPLNSHANQSPLFHPVTRLFCGMASHDDWVVYDYSDARLKKLAESAARSLQDYNVSIHEFAAEDPRKMLVYGEARYDPGSYYFIDFGVGKYVIAGESYPDLPTPWVTQKQKLSYKATDGLEIHGYLTLPPNPALAGREPKNLPLIVLPHGGPNARDTLSFDWQVQLYASRGYAVLQPNFRGSTGYGEAFVSAGYAQWGRKMQSDLSDGVRYLTQDGTIDPQRVCIVGASYGGYAALAGVTLDPGVYNCAVSIAGISDLKAMLDYDASQSGAPDSPLVLYMKRSVGNRKTLDEVSPIRHVAKVTVPVLLIHGRDDIVVDIGQSRRMEKALKAAGKDVTFIELQGEDHWSSVEARRIEMSNAIITFIEKHNPPG